MRFSPKFTSWAQSQKSPCAVLRNVRQKEAPVLKLSGNINWEARDEQIRERNEKDKGLPGEGHPRF